MTTPRRFVWEYEVEFFDERGNLLNVQTVFVRDDVDISESEREQRAHEYAQSRIGESPGLKELLGDEEEQIATATLKSFTDRQGGNGP